MKKNAIHIIIVDDHPLNIDAYKNLITHHLNNTPVDFFSATSSEEAIRLLHDFEGKHIVPHYAFVDYNLPEFEPLSIYNGSDLSLYIKNKFPNCKIIFITMHNEPAIIGNILNAVNPEGLLSKSDVSFITFKEIIETIFLHHLPYRSPSIHKAENIIFRNNLDWDENDYKILELLAKGEQTNNLPNFIPLGLSAIEKRKAAIKKQLLLDGGNDKDLVNEARKRGLL